MPRRPLDRPPPLLGALLAAGLLLLAGGASPAAAQGRPRIVLDPGHGGAQEGAQGPGGVLEKHVALQIAQRLKRSLEAELGAQVFLTRETDRLQQLSARVLYANKKAPDLFISLHANSMPTRALRQQTEGVEVFFLSADASDDQALRTAARENAESPRTLMPDRGDILAFILADLARADAHGDSSRLAHAVHKSLVAQTGAHDRGVHQAPFYVLMGVEAPAILVECGYVSHPRESQRLASAEHQERIAQGIARGVKQFLAQRPPGARVARPAGE